MMMAVLVKGCTKLAVTLSEEDSNAMDLLARGEQPEKLEVENAAEEYADITL